MKKFFLLCFIIFTILGLTTTKALADVCPNQSPDQVCNPIGAATLPIFALRVLNIATLGIGGLTIMFTVFAGFRMIISQGNAEDVEKAKQTLQWTISGMIVAMSAYVIVSAISSFLGVKPFSTDISTTDSLNPIASPTFAALLNKMTTGFLELVGLLAVVMIVISGFRYITARGNNEQSEQAKEGLQWAIIGLIIALFAYVIVRATATFFGVK